MTAIKRNLTPAHLRCRPVNCPAVHELEDGRILIIGKKPSLQELAEFAANGIGWDEGEEPVLIGREYLCEL